VSLKPLPAWLRRCQSNRVAAPSASARIAIAQLKTDPVWRSTYTTPAFRSGNACVQNH
jgi:hypothetical protein